MNKRKLILFLCPFLQLCCLFPLFAKVQLPAVFTDNMVLQRDIESMKTDGNKAILTFKQKGSGLQAKSKYVYLKSFAIAGNDQKFVLAKAYIKGDKVIVYSEKVNNPVAVRYGWANNPDDANLYNTEGFPASPFRTDNWETITQKR